MNKCGLCNSPAKRKWCSPECYDQARRGQWIIRQCEACHCTFRVRENASWKKFCSKKCNDRIYQRKRSAEAKQKLMDVYGHECNCCSEHRIEFLTLEHKQRDRKRDILEIGYTSNRIWLHAAENPDFDRYEILCMNCNWCKGKFGYCPHEKEKQ